MSAAAVMPDAKKWTRPTAVPVRSIVGNAEVRRLAGGITRHTLIRWRERENFPPPVRALESGEIWDARQVREWLAARDAARYGDS